MEVLGELKMILTELLALLHWRMLEVTSSVERSAASSTQTVISTIVTSEDNDLIKCL